MAFIFEVKVDRNKTFNSDSEETSFEERKSLLSPFSDSDDSSTYFSYEDEEGDLKKNCYIDRFIKN